MRINWVIFLRINRNNLLNIKLIQKIINYLIQFFINNVKILYLKLLSKKVFSFKLKCLRPFNNLPINKKL